MSSSDMTILLSGVVGSTAYGLATPESDVDRLGLFAYPTEKLLGLGKPTDSLVTTKPDRTLHEVGKWCGLAMNCNPTAMEIAWLPDELYDERHILGDELIGIRTAFLSARRVKDAYLGYATQQFRRLETRADGSFSADTRKRTAKHARHLLRLLHQGYMLYATGALILHIGAPERYFDFGERVAEGDLDIARKAISDYEEVFASDRTVLSEAPDRNLIEDWLLRVRRHLY